MTETSKVTVVKARLRNFDFGIGFLEVKNDAVRYYVEKGRFRKQREVAKEIRIADVENVERRDGDVAIAQKDIVYVFALEKPEELDMVYEQILAALKGSKEEALKEPVKEPEKEQKTEPAEPLSPLTSTASTETVQSLKPADETEKTEKTEKKEELENIETPIEVRNEFVPLTGVVIETADALFSLLKSLHGRIDWKQIQEIYKQFEENASKLSVPEAGGISFDLQDFSVAVQESRAKELSQKASEVLSLLYSKFEELLSRGANSKQYHLNQHDAKLMIQAFYILNDLMLAAIVGDEETNQEKAELLAALDRLAKLPDSKIDAKAVKASLDKISLGKVKPRVGFEETTSRLKEQLVALIPPTAAMELSIKEAVST
jgi:hypothetical protein